MGRRGGGSESSCGLEHESQTAGIAASSALRRFSKGKRETRRTAQVSCGQRGGGLARGHKARQGKRRQGKRKIAENFCSDLFYIILSYEK